MADPTLPTRVYLIRHGGTVSSDANLFAGSSDVALSDAGRAQVAHLAARLAPRAIDAAYCSDLQRTRETAAILCAPHKLTPTPLAALREIGHGHWEGQAHGRIEREFAAEYAAWSADPLNYAPPGGGETGLSVLARALPAVTRIVADHPGQTVLIVSHTATNRLLLAALLGLDPRLYRERLGQDLACLNVLEFRGPARPKLLVMNDTSHWGGPRSA